jgi:very-short-patch-repair endonuclease
MTRAEKKLWSALRDRRFAAYKFRRQVPVGLYVADFMCFDARLIIEVDGSQHVQSAHDAQRDAWLASQNFLVKRFWNEHAGKRA